MGFFVMPYAIAQNPNEYRAYVSGQFIDSSGSQSVTQATMTMKVTYVPMYPSVTYTMTERGEEVIVDLTQPQLVNTQIAQQIKEKGATYGYDVLKIYVPSYELKVP